MVNLLKYLTIGLLFTACASTKNIQNSSRPNDEHRPQLHFTPGQHWMNDPNGMVYLNGKYHLFFQHYPSGTKWGPMHWGHATSEDLIHWEDQPIALFPDSLGWIFSGSAVYDKNNTSGLGKDGKMPLVAIFTHHNQALEQAGSKEYQYQSIAYSLDEGKTWVKYPGNPVLKNPGIVDFRDPKVRWDDRIQKWIMTLATKDRITFYSSPDLKDWAKESEFGESVGAHGGVWECPDLFPMQVDGKTVWVLLVSINPGGPNKGSATQYFIGDFDGKTFTPFNTDTKWVDWGTDNYAGVTFSNVGARNIFIGWMNNWQYANEVPTAAWRGAATFPRELSLLTINNSIYLASLPVKELNKIISKTSGSANISVSAPVDLSDKIDGKRPYSLEIDANKLQSFSIVLSNNMGEELVLGFDKTRNEYFIDRSKSGKVSFEKGFGAKHSSPRISTNANTTITLLVDAASVELFADGGLNVMTDIFFPNKPFDKLLIKSDENFIINNLKIHRLKNIWDKNE